MAAPKRTLTPMIKGILNGERGGDFLAGGGEQVATKRLAKNARRSDRRHCLLELPGHLQKGRDLFSALGKHQEIVILFLPRAVCTCLQDIGECSSFVHLLHRSLAIFRP